jgi:hypothetical protein
MIHFSQNHVRTAVDRLGGATKASNAMGVSNTAIHTWIRNQRVNNIDKARRMAELAGLELQQLRSTL